MKIKVNRFFYSLYTTNQVRETRRYIRRIAFCIVFLSCFINGYSYAGTWRDLFDQAKPHDWERLVEVNRWETEWNTMDGRLIVSINKHGPAHVPAADILRWKAQRFKLNRLTVVGENIAREPTLKEGNSGVLCLFLGKWNAASDSAEGYFFGPTYTERMRFTAKGVYKLGRSKGHYRDRLPLTSGHLKVVFENSRFRLFTEDILLLDFIDEDIIFVDLVGVVIILGPFAKWSLSSISTFSISGRDIPNHNSLDVQVGGNQLTTIWGRLKWKDE